MKRAICFAILTTTFFSACKKDWSVPASICTIDFNDSSALNPKKQQYQSLLDQYVRNGIPGMVLLVRTPKEGLWIGTAGVAKIETGEPMLACHVHHSASVAKMYMGVATMLLAEDGKINLDAPMNTYLDAEMCSHIDNADKATVRQLLNHTSGIRDFVYEPGHLTDYFNNFFNTHSTQHFLEYIYDKKADFAPGEKAKYCNTGFVLLSLIIDRVTGKSHAEFLSERIFKKLHLDHTYYKNEPGYPRPAGLVNSYMDRFANGKIENNTEIAIRFDSLSVGHDAMLATAHDYAKFIEGVFKSGLLTANSLKEMMVWKYDAEERESTGLGILKRDTPFGEAIGHAGGNLGVAMDMRYYPKHDVTIVFCANFSGFLDSPVLTPLDRFSEAVEKIAFQ